MRKVFNFNPGPAMLPEEVLIKAQQELLDWHGTGMSAMELGHRGNEFQQIIAQTEQDLREILSIPANYHILFLAGGATAQFAMIPLNFLATKKTADYINTGIWSDKAIAEAQRYGTINVAAKSVKDPQVRILDQKQWSLNPNAAYVHYTPNETIDGVEFHWIPETGNVPLIADMSSTILSRPIDVTKFGMIYAGAQKNMGQSGVTIVIIRDDLVQACEPFSYTPSLYDYRLEVKNQSLYNTPPTYSWYIAGLVFDWVKRQGGLKALATINQRKAEKLYNAIDSSEFYFNSVHPSCRSWMNIPFSLKDDNLNDLFLKESHQAGLANLKGHRAVGGMRASIYNAMPEAGVDALVEFMHAFAHRHG